MLACACVGGGDAALPELETGNPLVLETEAGLARFEVTPIDAESLQQGENRLSVRLLPTEAETHAILTEVSGFMPAHGHGASATILRHGTDDFEVNGLTLSMPGRWELRLLFVLDGTSDEASFAADVH